MCMRYINATTSCFKSITVENGEIISYNAPFTGIKSNRDNEILSVNNFVLLTQIDFLGTNNEEHKKENSLEQKKVIDFIIRITKCDKDETKRIGCDLDKFSVDLNDLYKNNQVNLACFGFVNYTRMTKVEHLDLPGGTGKYVIKVLVKDSEDSDYTIQTMTKLTIL